MTELATQSRLYDQSILSNISLACFQKFSIEGISTSYFYFAKKIIFMKPEYISQQFPFCKLAILKPMENYNYNYYKLKPMENYQKRDGMKQIKLFAQTLVIATTYNISGHSSRAA